MMVQAAVIQIHGPADSRLVIRHTHLAVAEAGRPFIDPDAVPCQRIVVNPRACVDQFLVRYTRGDHADIHAASGRQRQRADRFIGQDQIRRNVPAVLYGLVRHAHVYILADINVIQRTVRVGLHQGACLFLRIFEFRQILLKMNVILIALFDRVPVLKKCHGQAPYARTGNLHAGILPQSVRMRQVEIFIGQVVSAGEADTSVDHGDLPVIPVVQEDVQSGCERIENTAFDADGFQAGDEILVDETDRPHVVIEYADLHAGADAFFQDLLDAVPGFGVFDRMVFHENEMLRFFHFRFLRCETGCSIVIIFDVGIRINGISCKPAYIIRDAGQLRIEFFHGCRGFGSRCSMRSFRQLRQKDIIDIPVTLPHFVRLCIEPDDQIDAQTDDRCCHDENDPGHADAGGLVHAVDAENGEHGNDTRRDVDPGSVMVEFGEDKDQKDGLQKENEDGENHTKNAVLNGCFFLQSRSAVHFSSLTTDDIDGSFPLMDGAPALSFRSVESKRYCA